MEYTVNLGKESLKKIANAIGGVEVEELNITQNGVYTAPDGKAYSPVVVNVEGGGGESWETIFDGELTTVIQGPATFASVAIGTEITADTIKVTFNGEEYTLNKQTDSEGDYYGEIDADSMPLFTTYPFFISGGMLSTPEAGTYALKVEEPGQSGGSSDFSTAEVTVTGGGRGNCASIQVLNNISYASYFVQTGVNTVILTENGAILHVDTQSYEVRTMSGDIEPMQGAEGYYLITGNCNIEIAIR